MSTGVTAPLGFRAAAVASGIKPDRLDLALLVADAGCTAAGVFTANLAQAAPVLVSREHLASGRARAIVVNAGCANAGTGEGGLDDARETAEIVAHTIGCAVEEVLVASTGVIGVRLPMEKVRAGIAEAGRRISRHAGADAARAIMTTDTKPKEVAVEFPVGDATCVVGGMAKGAGHDRPEPGDHAGLLHDRRRRRARAPAPRPRRGGRREPQPDHRGRRHLDERLRHRARERRAPRPRHRPRGPRLRRLPPRAHRGGPPARADAGPGRRGRDAHRRGAGRGGANGGRRPTASPARWPSRRS